MEKPYYIIEFSAAACLVEIRVNDVPVLVLDLPGQASSIVPVNFAILGSGKQTLTARILPISGSVVVDANAKLSYQLKLYNIKSAFEYQETLLQYEFAKVDPENKRPVFQNMEQFEARVPYQLTGWKNGQALKDIDGVTDKLIRAYQKITGFIRNRDYEAFRGALANREKLMATSMYLEGNNPGKRVDNLIRDFENGFDLIPFEKDLVVQFYAGGKMAALRRLNGDHAICAQNIEKDEEVLLDLAFYIPEGKTEFEVV